MSSVGQLQAEMIGRPGLLGLWIFVDMVCLSPVGYGVQLTFQALALRRSRLLHRDTADFTVLH